MTDELKREARRRRRQRFVTVFWLAFAVLTALFSICYVRRHGFVCVIRGLTGIPCPSCGMTRAIASFLRLDFAAAFYFHPLFWSPPLILASGLAAALTNRARKPFLVAFIMLLLAFFVCWLLRLCAGTLV